MARYIDADKLLKEFDVDTSKDVMDISDIVFGVVTSIIERQPTADVVEVKQGEWIKNNTQCSVCKELNPTMYLNEYELEYYARPLPHCPFCCAKMDGGNT